MEKRPGSPSLTRREADERADADRPLTIEDLSWSREDAAAVRARLASFIPDWDDPEMDVYNDL